MLYLNGQPVPVTHFPDNTSQIWKLTPEMIHGVRSVDIKWRFEHEGEIAHLGQLKMLLQSYGIRANLFLTYLPYGRQDKEVSNTTTFALRNFAHSINAMAFDEVKIMDPHSDVALELIRFSEAIYPIEKVDEVFNDIDSDIICYPDSGALKKYVKVFRDVLGPDSYPYIYGEKVRDQLTGNITSYKLIGNCYGQNVLIVDDICDGGATFKILAKDLLANGAKSVALFVTHGIFSKGVRTLMDAGIARVFTADCEVTARHNSQNI